MAFTPNYGTGKDGDISRYSNTVYVNTCARITSISGNRVNFTNIQTSTGVKGFSVGDEIMIYRTRGKTQSQAGDYDFYTIAEMPSATVIVTDKPVKDIFVGATSQVIRVENYNNVMIANGTTVRPFPYDGASGGVIAIRINGTLTIDSATFDANAVGYTTNDLNQPNGNNLYISRTNQGSAKLGGDGGSNQFRGGYGYYQDTFSFPSASEIVKENVTSYQKMFFGGSGSKGGSASSGSYKDGGTGGGIIYIQARNIKIQGSSKYPFQANGAKGMEADNINGGGAGGGAGGTIILASESITGASNYFAGATGGGGAGRFYGSDPKGPRAENGVNNKAGNGSHGWSANNYPGKSYESNGGGGAGAGGESGGNATALKAGDGAITWGEGGGGGGAGGFILVYSSIKPSVITYPAIIFDTIIKSNPPSTPGQPTINMISTLTGEQVTAQWSASTISDGSAIEYQVEFYNGSSWEQVKTVPEISCSFIISAANNTESAKVRVTAIGISGNSSSVESKEFKVLKMLLLIRDGDIIKTYKDGVWQTI
ncbi:fibronectin type III domain-containing protein [Bacillus mobilis]|uniref:fibronectin type III domain-containing protein n=1 Tax=Bacillus mobilis TaxID=2026190 RepID=UPI00367413C6